MSDVRVAVIRDAVGAIFSNNTSFTQAGFGTPSGALVFGTTTYDAQFSMGFWDATDGYGTSVWSEDAVTTVTDCKRYHVDYNATEAEVLSELGTYSGPPLPLAAWKIENTTNGVKLTCSYDQGHGYGYGWGLDVTAILFGGGGVDVHTDKLLLTTGADANTYVQDLNFQPDLIFWMTVGEDTNPTTLPWDEHSWFSFGATTNNGSIVNRMVCTYDDDAVGTSDNGIYVSTDGCVGVYDNQALQWEAKVDEITASGFRINNEADPAGDYVFYMAIGLGDDYKADVHTLTSKTSAGTQAKSGLGFEPAFLIGALTNADALDTDDSVQGLGLSVGAAMPSGTTTGHFDCGFGIWSEDAHALSNTGANSDQGQILNLRDNTDGTVFIRGVVDSLDSDGYTLDYKTTDGTARYGFMIAMSSGVTVAEEEEPITYDEAWMKVDVVGNNYFLLEYS